MSYDLEWCPRCIGYLPTSKQLLQKFCRNCQLVLYDKKPLYKTTERWKKEKKKKDKSTIEKNV